MKFLLISFVLLLSSASAAFADTPKSLVIALDGTRADAIDIATMPNVQSLISGTWAPGYHGAYASFAQTIKDTDTLSGPNHTSIYTGVTGAKHGVTGNFDEQLGAVKYPDYLQLLELRNRNLNTAKLYTWSPDGLVHSGADYTFDGDDDNNAKRAAGIIAGTYSDANWTVRRDVDALFIFFDDVDHAGHSSGWLSPAYYRELGQIDRQIGKILTAVRNRPNFSTENWQIILTSDHGGYGLSHGTRASAYFTIPFLVSSRTIAQGSLAGRVRNMDVAPTVLEHFGIDPTQTFFANVPGSNGQQNLSDPYRLDGVARKQVVPVANTSISSSLVAYFRMNDSFVDGSGRNNTLVPNGDVNFVNGKFGNAARIATKSGVEFLNFGTPAQSPDLNFGTNQGQNPSFTVTMWYRGKSTPDNADPCLFCNKNWDSGTNPGFVLTPNIASGKTFSDELGLNLADTDGRRIDLLRISTEEAPNQWWLYAFTVDRSTGLATLYAGSPGGKLYFVANEIDVLRDLSSFLPINAGQDGTGNYTYQVTASLDDIGIWRRALSKAEIQTIYNQGTGRELTTLLNQP